MNVTKPTSNEEYIVLLEEQQYDEILLECKDYIKEKVDSYLRNFHYYHQFRTDFYHEVCIHILTKSLPSPAFLKACKNGNTFKFYLAKSIRNILNTLLSKEKNKRANMVALDNYSGTDREFDQEKLPCFIDKSYTNQTDSQDILDQLQARFDQVLNNFVKVFPKIAYKLILLLKLQARAFIYEQDLQRCFAGIKRKDVKKFLNALGEDEDYRQKEDKEIYAVIHPYFQAYRKEKGSPAALQRWLNQHISGDKFTTGILDNLEIKEHSQSFRITDKKLFSDFLHFYFKTRVEETTQTIKTEKQTDNLVIERLQPNWLTAAIGQ